MTASSRILGVLKSVLFALAFVDDYSTWIVSRTHAALNESFCVTVDQVIAPPGKLRGLNNFRIRR